MATWRDRLKTARYTDPDGIYYEFDYEDLSREGTLRGTVFEFTGIDGGYVQQRGFGARRYPLQCIFSGADCDLKASTFEAAILKPGIGELDHPIYGTVKVVPFGDWTRRDDLLTGANQAVVELTFVTSLENPYPGQEADLKNEIQRDLDSFSDSAATQFAGSVDASTLSNRASLASTVKRMLAKVNDKMSLVSRGADAITGEDGLSIASVRAEFQSAYDTLNSAVDTLVGKPYDLAQQVVNLVLSPSKALGGIAGRLLNYGDLWSDLVSDVAASPAIPASAIASDRAKLANNFLAADLFATSAVVGQISTAVSVASLASSAYNALSKNDFTSSQKAALIVFSTRPKMLNAAIDINDKMLSHSTWRDLGFANLNSVALNKASYDTAESLLTLQKLASSTSAYLVNEAFSAVPERRVVLSSERSIIDLCFELYGEVDSKLDFFINTNNFSVNEILEIPRGRSVVYYSR